MANESEKEIDAIVAEAARVDSVSFREGEFRAVIDGKLQKPVFNAHGPAIAFALAVVRGTRAAEPAV